MVTGKLGPGKFGPGEFAPKYKCSISYISRINCMTRVFYKLKHTSQAIATFNCIRN